MDRKWWMLAVLSLAELLAMTLWFSASAVGPELAAAWGLTPAETAWLTNAVQLGFVAGALASAALTISDVVPPRYLVAASAVVGALATAVIAAVVDSFLPAVALRFLTGAALAGVYPPGMKLMAGWFEEGRGFAIGVLVGALAVGSAAPHLLRAVGGIGNPRVVLYGASALAVLGGALALLVEPGPYQAPVAPFDPSAVYRVATDRPTMLANLGYFGHMWELYAVWTWISAYLAAGWANTLGGDVTALLAFTTIAAGGLGAAVAGRVADRFGRTRLTAASMTISGACSVLATVVFGASLVVLVPFLLVWGITVVADSAQFSAAVSELADPSYVGSALTLQTAVGFLLTTASIQLTAVVADAYGWEWAFLPLVLGPLAGTASMLALGRSPAASRLAGGRG